MMVFIRTASVIISILVMLSSGHAKGNSTDLFEQAMEAFKSGNYGNAQLIFRKVIDNDDLYRDRSWFHLSLSIFYQKKYDSAIFEFNRFLLNCSTANLCSESRFWIAESHYNLKDYLKAIEEYKKFISQKSNDQLILTAIDRIGDIYFIQGRYDEAVIEWKKTVSTRPTGYSRR
jgi:TolA-binding protein